MGKNPSAHTISKGLIIAILLVLTISLSVGFSGAGSGTGSDPYQISNLSELNQTREDLSASYELVSDINASETKSWNNGSGWSPIATPDNPFQGQFDGKSHRITQLTINRSSTNYIGLFSYLGSSATIKNTRLQNSSIKGNNYVAGLTGYNEDGNIDTIIHNGTISGEEYVGGIVGYNTGDISSSSNSGTIKSSEIYAGGIAAYNNRGSIVSSYNLGDIDGVNEVGGLVGRHRGSIESSYSAGKVSGIRNTGGLIGSVLSGSYSNNYWDVEASSQLSSAADSSSGVTSLNSGDFDNKTKLSGFDFTDTWEFVGGTDKGYPVFQILDKSVSPPNASIAASMSSGLPVEDEINVNNSVRFRDDLSGAYPGGEFNWSIGNLKNSTKENPSYKFDSFGEHTVELDVSNIEGSDTFSKTFEVISYPCSYGGTRNSSCIVNETRDRISDNYNITGSGNLTIGENGVLEGPERFRVNFDTVNIENGGSISGNVEVFSENLDVNNLDSINAVGKGESGKNGSIKVCESVPSVSCFGKDESGVNLNTSLNKTGDGIYKVRNITDKWSEGYLNWTENVSRTSKYDQDWSSVVNADYRVSGLTENLEFKILKDGDVIANKDSGSEKNISFSADLTGRHRFEILESETPSWSNQKQGKNLVGLAENNSLVTNVSDVGSGVSKLVLATNESGSWENRTSYEKELDRIKSSEEVGVNWSSSSFQDEVEQISWKFYFEDTAGNWNSTDTKTFTIDGKAPEASNLTYKPFVDVDSRSTDIKLNVSDSPSGLSDVIIEENSSGSFKNYTMTSVSDTGYEYTLSKSDPGVVDYRIHANDTEGNTKIIQKSVKFQNITLTALISDFKANIGEKITVSGTALREPLNNPVDSLEVEAWITDSLVNQGLTNSKGEYAFEASSTQPGNKSLKINATDSNNISGFNYTQTLSVFNLSTRITSVGTRKVFRDSSSDVDLSFEDNITSDSRNPLVLENVEANYEFPDNWNRKFLNSSFGNLEPGDSASNNPEVDIGPNSRLGEHEINLTSSSKDGIGSKDNITIEVWSKADTAFLNTPEVIDQDNENFTFEVEVTDYTTGEIIPQHKVKFSVGDQSATNVANESGVAKFNIDVSSLDVGTPLSVTANAGDNPDIYTNSTSDVSSHLFEVLGIMNIDGSSTTSSVYRKPKNSEPGTAFLNFLIEDSNENKLSDVSSYLTIENTSKNKKTGETGSVDFNYNPDDDLKTGLYDVNVTFSKDNFKELNYADTLEVRGILDIEQIHGYNEFIVDQSYILSSNVTDQNNNVRAGNTNWSIGDRRINTGDQITWTPDLGPGSYTLNTTTNKQFFDDDTESKEVEVFGEAKITEFSPNTSQIKPGTEIEVETLIKDRYTEEPIEDMNVNITSNGSTIEKGPTNSNGVFTTSWTPEEGVYDLTASINRQEDINYIPSEYNKTSEIEIVKSLRLEEFNISEKEIYRNSVKSPSETIFEANISETSDQEKNVPSDNVNVTFNVDNTEKVNCYTDSNGYCSTAYEPSSDVSLGNLNVTISTNKSNWRDIREKRSINIIGILSLGIDNPEEKIVRGKDNVLESTAFSGEELDVPANWSYRDQKIEEDLDTTWSADPRLEKGEGVLEVQAGSEKYETSTDQLDIPVYGQSEVSMENSKDSVFSYTETPEIRCNVENGLNNGISDYPVNLAVGNNNKAISHTNEEGVASIEWNTPKNPRNYSVGCNISNNNSMYYLADEKIAEKNFTVVDDVSPTISNLSITPGEPQLEDNATINFSTADEIELETVEASVETPDGQEEILELRQKGENYSSNYTTKDIQGTYNLRIDVSDSSDNTASRIRSFDVEPRGSIDINSSRAELSEITQENGSSFDINTTFTADEKAENISLRAVPAQDSTDVSVQNSELACNQDLEANESCSKSFTVNVDAGATPKTDYVFFEASWDSVEQGETSQVEKVLPIDILENPVLKAGELRSLTVAHGGREVEELELKSVGNYKIEDYLTEFNENNLTQNWVNISNSRANSISPGESIVSDVTVNLPEGAAPGLYTSRINFNSSNVETKRRDVNISVPSDVSFDVSPKSQSTGAVVDYRDEIAKFEIVSTGNINTTIDSETTTSIDYLNVESGFTLDKQSSRNISVEVETSETGIQTADLLFETNEPEVPSSDSETVELEVDATEFNTTLFDNSNTIEKTIGENFTIGYELSIGEDPVNQNFTVTPRFQMTNSTGFSRRSENVWTEKDGDGRHISTIEIPDIPDARTYDLVLEITKTDREVTTQSILDSKIRIPDTTPPNISNIETRSIESGDNLTVNITGSDNNLKGKLNGVENTSLTLFHPSGKTETYYPSVQNDKWRLDLNNLSETGLYRLNARFTDPENNKANQSKLFRAAPIFNAEGEFESSNGEKLSGEISFTDTKTKDKINSSLDGKYNFSIQEGTYDVGLNFSENSLSMKNVNVTENNTNIKAQQLESDSAPAPENNGKLSGIAVETDFKPSSANITLKYSEENIPQGEEIEDVELARCSNFDYSSQNCESELETYDIKQIDKPRDEITASVPGFSAYTLFFPSEAENEEEQTNSGGGGGGSAPDYSQELSEINDSVSEVREKLSINDTEKASFGSNSIDAQITPGENKRISLEISNEANNTQVFEIRPNEIISPYIDSPNDVKLSPGESKDILLNVSAPADERPGSYSGVLNIQSTEVETRMPVNIGILPPDNELLDLSITPIFPTVKPGDEMRVEVFASNEGFVRNIDITVNLELVDPDTGEIVIEKQETLAIGTTLTNVMSLQVPEGTEMKQYELRGSTQYTNIDTNMSATSISNVNIDLPFWQREALGITYKSIAQTSIVVFLLSLIGYSGYSYRKQKILEKKRYLESIDLDQIPEGGNKQGFIGEIAEMGKRTFIDLDDLTTHALIAGSTGSGKTVTGQVIIEEALKKGVNVIVLDPTAQWTGFLRENDDSVMKQLYRDFGMSQNDARAFNGNIRAVEPSSEKVDIEPYLNEDDKNGDIIVFSMHKLDNENMDKFVDTTIQQVFDANLNEKDHLETLIVYDEAHRILEKFGGSGEGVKQLERGAREFRKWGIGMMLFSQVVSDFPKEFRANVNTTVQMRTQYQGDLEHIKEKFGVDTVKSIAKAEVGSGMLHNPNYNRGRPYFVNFRPLLHSSHRLSDQKLDKYEEFNKRISGLEQKIKKIEESGEEVYEYRSEIKLAKKNLRKGSFNLVNMYLDEIQDKLEN